ncbi:MAG TPA: PadR family transcriptional regulator, partial [Opitutaceae bacterium]
RERPFVANWMLEELREHGYRVSPGTLYPLLQRLCELGWLKKIQRAKSRGGLPAAHYTSTKAGRTALKEVQARLRELQHEVFSEQ